MTEVAIVNAAVYSHPQHEPVGWGDSDWWRSPNAVHDVGEVHARWRREAARMRRRAADALPVETFCHEWLGSGTAWGTSYYVCWRCGAVDGEVAA